jgi:hypothetical protein
VCAHVEGAQIARCDQALDRVARRMNRARYRLDSEALGLKNIILT